MKFEKEDFNLGDVIRCQDDTGCIYTGRIFRLNLDDLYCIVDHIEVDGQCHQYTSRPGKSAMPTYAWLLDGWTDVNLRERVVKALGEDPDYWKTSWASGPNYKQHEEWVVEKLTNIPNLEKRVQPVSLDVSKQAREAAWGKKNHTPPAGAAFEFL